MNKPILTFCFLLCCCTQALAIVPKTYVTIKGDDFYINGKITYQGVTWNGHRIEGLLFNSRMVQGVFDDENPDTRDLFKYPDTGKWDPDRNTNEFLAAMKTWREHGLLAFTLNLQGGSPIGYGNHGWVNTAFDEDGNLKKPYLKRLKKILDRADDLGMVVILGYFYQGQDEHLRDERAVLNAVDNATNWLLRQDYRNVMVEVDNECDVTYDHPILAAPRVHELIARVKAMHKGDFHLLVSTSFRGNAIPTVKVANVADFLLIHGNKVEKPERIAQMVTETRAQTKRQIPVLFNEDDHYDFDKHDNNLISALKMHASWGYFDYRRDGEKFEEGFQSVPVDWQINSARKKGFFNLIKNITNGSGQ